MYLSRTPGSNITDQDTEPFYERVSKWRQFAQVKNSFNGKYTLFSFCAGQRVGPFRNTSRNENSKETWITDTYHFFILAPCHKNSR
jgi:hypothetical protein